MESNNFSDIEQSKEFQELLRPLQLNHVPLTHNFYEAFLRKNPGYDKDMETSSAPSTTNMNTTTSTSSSSKLERAVVETPSNATATSKVVKEILETNKQLIEQAAMQNAAAEVNVNTAQYNNLIPLSFDQEQFLQNLQNQAASTRRK